MTTIKNSSVEGCSLSSTHDDILILQIKREIKELARNHEKDFLKHDGKIAEMCKYIKDNLSNTLKSLIDNMQVSGELDHIITETVLSEIELVNIKNGFYINVKELGIIGNGKTDETVKMEEVLSKGIDIIIPSGCNIVISRALNVNSSIKGCPGSSIKQITKRSNILNLQSDSITIDGLTLIGTGEGFEGESVEGAGTLIMSYGKNNTIKNTTFKDANYVGCFIEPKATNNVIENCQFINCWAEGISVQSDYSKVKNCYFENCSYNGCVVRGAAHVIVDGCQFIDCSITDVALDIKSNYDKTKFCSDCILSNNYFKNAYMCISLYDGDPDNTHNNITIKGNRFNGRENSEVGVRAYYTKNVKVIGNTFEQAGTLTTLLFSGCTNVVCTDNILSDGSLGIDCSCEETATIKGNNLKNFTNIGIRTRTYKAQYNHNFIVANNNLFNCVTGIKTEGNYNKSIIIDANSIYGSDKDLDITGAMDIFVLTNNSLNINKPLEISAQRNTYIKANNTIDKLVCSSSTRPKSPTAGDMSFDTSVNKPIWFNGTAWVDSTGTAV